MRNCIIGQSGGPTAAINSTLAGIIKKCNEMNYDHIYGMINGVQGFLEGQYIDLKEVIDSEDKLKLLKHSPAMYLGSCRYKLPALDSEDQSTYTDLFTRLKALDVTDVFYIGGNDSMDTVAKMSKYAKSIQSDMHVIGLPKTIDNDLMNTDHTPGFGSAAKYVASSMLEIVYDSAIYKLDAVTIVEIMGRNAGWLTAASALARTDQNMAPDLIYLPEVPFDKQKFLYDIGTVLNKKSSVVVAVSEGIKDKDGNYLDSDSDYARKDVFGNILHSGTGKVLEGLVSNYFGCKVRSIELNVLQRCAMHIASKVDLDESFDIGQYAVEQACQGVTNGMVVINRLSSFPYKSEFRVRNVSHIANLEHKVPVEWINEDHNDVTPALVEYLYPLIQGEVAMQYENGIPKYIDIKHLEHTFHDYDK